jgi:hypothetical protein
MDTQMESAQFANPDKLLQEDRISVQLAQILGAQPALTQLDQSYVQPA